MKNGYIFLKIKRMYNLEWENKNRKFLVMTESEFQNLNNLFDALQRVNPTFIVE